MDVGYSTKLKVSKAMKRAHHCNLKRSYYCQALVPIPIPVQPNPNPKPKAVPKSKGPIGTWADTRIDKGAAMHVICNRPIITGNMPNIPDNYRKYAQYF